MTTRQSLPNLRPLVLAHLLCVLVTKVVLGEDALAVLELLHPSQDILKILLMDIGQGKGEVGI